MSYVRPQTSDKHRARDRSRARTAAHRRRYGRLVFVGVGVAFVGVAFVGAGAIFPVSAIMCLLVSAIIIFDVSVAAGCIAGVSPAFLQAPTIATRAIASARRFIWTPSIRNRLWGRRSARKASTGTHNVKRGILRVP